MGRDLGSARNGVTDIGCDLNLVYSEAVLSTVREGDLVSTEEKIYGRHRYGLISSRYFIHLLHFCFKYTYTPAGEQYSASQAA